jgi:hypothetical protein
MFADSGHRQAGWNVVLRPVRRHRLDLRVELHTLFAYTYRDNTNKQSLSNFTANKTNITRHNTVEVL